MNALASKEQIQDSLKAFSSGNLKDNARRLFKVLGYHSEKRIDLSPNTAQAFLEAFDPHKRLNTKTALLVSGNRSICSFSSPATKSARPCKGGSLSVVGVLITRSLSPICSLPLI
jgi:hypothetical protein